MRLWIFYSAIAAVMCLGLYERISARSEAVSIAQHDIRPVAEKEMMARGFLKAPQKEVDKIFAYSTIKTNNYSVYLHRECGGSIIMMVANIGADNSHLKRKLRRNNDRVAFLFFDRKWYFQHRLQQSLQWFKINGLHSFGDNIWLPTKQGVLLFADKHCDPVHEVDWSAIWLKDRYATELKKSLPLS